MVDDVDPSYLPDIWGGGQLLAFSALDGPTDVQYGLCARTADEGAGIDVVLPGCCRVHFTNAVVREATLTGDCFGVMTAAGCTRGAFLDAYHLLIEGACTVMECDDTIQAVQEGRRVLIAPAGRFDMSRIDADLGAAIRDRQRWLRSIELPANVPE